MDKTKIQWTDATWNPLRGCSRVSAGCMNCYAERMAARFAGTDPRTGLQMPYAGLIDRHGRWNGRVGLVEDHLFDPLRWKKPPHRLLPYALRHHFGDMLLRGPVEVRAPLAPIDTYAALGLPYHA